MEAVDTSDFDSWFQKGMHKLVLGEHEDALSSFLTAADTSSRDGSTTIAQLYAAYSAGQMGNLRQAINLYGLVVDADPTNVVALMNRGTCFQKLGEVDLACTAFSAAMAHIKRDDQLNDEMSDKMGVLRHFRGSSLGLRVSQWFIEMFMHPHRV